MSIFCWCISNTLTLVTVAAKAHHHTIPIKKGIELKIGKNYALNIIRSTFAGPWAFVQRHPAYGESLDLHIPMPINPSGVFTLEVSGLT